MNSRPGSPSRAASDVLSRGSWQGLTCPNSRPQPTPPETFCCLVTRETALRSRRTQQSGHRRHEADLSAAQPIRDTSNGQDFCKCPPGCLGSRCRQHRGAFSFASRRRQPQRQARLHRGLSLVLQLVLGGKQRATPVHAQCRAEVVARLRQRARSSRRSFQG